MFTRGIHQVDSPLPQFTLNGLSNPIGRMVGQSIYAHIPLEKGERSTLAERASNLL